MQAGHVILDTMRLEALPGNRTRLTSHSAFLSVEDRDGMEEGVEDSYASLDELLARLRVSR